MRNRHYQALLTRVLEGDGHASPTDRRAAFDNTELSEPARTLVEKVVRHPHAISDEDIVAARAGGLSEDQIFELTVCTAIGESARQLQRALAVLDEATTES